MEIQEAREAWGEALTVLQHSMDKQTFDNLVSGSEVSSCENGTWTIGVRHPYAVEWLQQRLYGQVKRTVGRFAQVENLVFEHGVPEQDQPAKAKAKTRPAATRQTQAPTQETKRRSADEPILEAVREQRVAIDCNGKSLQYTDFYIRLKLAFRDRALRLLRGSKLSVFLCLALHVDANSVSSPGIEKIMEETDYSRQSVCTALAELVEMGFVVKLPRRHLQADRYEVKGYAWFGHNPAAALLEEE